MSLVSKPQQTLSLVCGKLSNKEPITLVRLGDGTRDIMWKDTRVVRSEKFGYLPTDPTGFSFDPDKHSYVREYLQRCAVYKHDDFYFAPLPGMWGRKLAAEGQDTSKFLCALCFARGVRQVWASLEEALRDREVVMLTHRAADISALPFNVVHHFKTAKDSFSDLTTLDAMCEYASANDGAVWLMAASVLVKMALPVLHEANPSNSYLDIGSCLDPLMGLGRTRLYLQRELGKEKPPVE